MNTDNISRYIYLGRFDKNWYAECRETIINIFGESELQLVSTLLAATSQNTSLKANVTLFRKAYYEIKNDLPVSDYLPGIKEQLTRIRAGGELRGQKITSFARAIQGDKNAVVVDMWLMRAFGMQSDSPTPKQYKSIESFCRQEGIYRGYHAAEISAMIWGGARRELGRDNETRFCDFLKYSFNNLFNVI